MFACLHSNPLTTETKIIFLKHIMDYITEVPWPNSQCPLLSITLSRRKLQPSGYTENATGALHLLLSLPGILFLPL